MQLASGTPQLPTRKKRAALRFPWGKIVSLVVLGLFAFLFI